jgi:cytochrome c oxidase cbb3-type subunit 3
MWTLVLTAALSLAPACLAEATAAPREGRGQEAVSREKAQELYTANCQACHGPDGKGSPLMKGSAFVKRQWKHGTTEAEMVQTISEGVKGTMMLPFKEKLKPEEIAGLAALVRSFDPALTKPAKVKK